MRLIVKLKAGATIGRLGRCWLVFSLGRLEIESWRHNWMLERDCILSSGQTSQLRLAGLQILPPDNVQTTQN